MPHEYDNDEVATLFGHYRVDGVTVLPPVSGQPYYGTMAYFRAPLAAYLLARKAGQRPRHTRVVVPISLGAHWVAVIINFDPDKDTVASIDFFDPFGFQANHDIATVLWNVFTPRKLYYSNVEYQHEHDRINCGPWIVAWFAAQMNGEALDRHLDMRALRRAHRRVTHVDSDDEGGSDGEMDEDDDDDEDGSFSSVVPRLTAPGALYYRCRFCRGLTTTDYVDFWGWKCSRCSSSLDDSQTPFSLVSQVPDDVVCRVIFYLDGHSMLALRQVSRRFLQLTQHAAGQSVPIRNAQQFLAATVRFFADFSKSQSRAVISRRAAFVEGWRLYVSIQVAFRPAYLELFNEKYFLFTNRVRKEMGPTGQLLDPRLWTPEVNDAWILGHLHQRGSFRMLAHPSTLANFWDASAGRPTALGRELYQIWRAGYRPAMSRVLSGDSLSGHGVLMVPTVQLRVPRIEHAPGASREHIIAILKLITTASASASITFPRYAVGVRRTCRLCGADVHLLWTQASGRWRATLKCDRDGSHLEYLS